MFSLKCHETHTDQNGMPYTVQSNNYVMLSHAGQRLWVQAGQVWQGENSSPLPANQLPDWFNEQIRQLSPQARREVGYLLPEDREFDAKKALEGLARDFDNLPDGLKKKLLVFAEGSGINEKAPKISNETSDMAREEAQHSIDSRGPRPKTWTCDTCQQTMSTKVKGVHIGRLRRLGSCANG